jgi:hypothetical protein
MTSQLQLNRISREIIEHAEQGLIPQKGLSKAVDDYFIQRLKQEEMEHAGVDARLYESLRNMVKAEVLPLYEQFRAETARVRERRQKRKVWQYVLGIVGVCEVLEAILTRGRSIAPPVLIPTAILYSFIGFIVYTAAQYFDDLTIARARRRLDKSIQGLEGRVQTDVDYDQRRELLDEDVLHAEALEILARYESSGDFWRDYCKVRETDPTLPVELKALNMPAFNRFLKFHIEGQTSAAARQNRFNRLFIEAHELFLSRDRANYALEHLKHVAPVKSPSSSPLSETLSKPLPSHLSRSDSSDEVRDKGADKGFVRRSVQA